MTELILVAVDPGDKYNGFAVYRSISITPPRWQKVKIGVRENMEELVGTIEALKPIKLVCEDFRLSPFARRPKGFSKLATSKMIGSLELLAMQLKIPFILQTTGNRDIGYKWGSIQKLPHSNPANHAHDAQAHAVYYIIKNGGLVVESK